MYVLLVKEDYKYILYSLWNNNRMSWAQKKRDVCLRLTTDETENISMYVKYLRIKFALKIRA